MAINKERLRLLRDRKGLTNRQIDERMGNTPMAYKYLDGVLEPGFDLLVNFLTVGMGYTVEELRDERLVDWYTTNGSKPL